MKVKSKKRWILIIMISLFYFLLSRSKEKKKLGRQLKKQFQNKKLVADEGLKEENIRLLLVFFYFFVCSFFSSFFGFKKRSISSFEATVFSGSTAKDSNNLSRLSVRSNLSPKLFTSLIICFYSTMDSY